jgi:anthranilate phosphoribosyltransferase
MLIKKAIGQIVEGRDLTERQAATVMTEIMEGKATPAQIASFLTALRIKGETVPEITGCARVMREKALGLKIDSSNLVDTCGTGGDQAQTFNISTTAAFVVAGAGLKVAKHGNRSVSSSCGSADLLEALGVNINLGPEGVEKAINKIGIGFLFAPQFHQAMKYAASPRQEIGIRTIFNILGPLTNPACARAQLVGVYKEELVMILAKVLRNLGCQRAFVVHSKDGLDEISIAAPTIIAELSHKKIRCYEINPKDFGLSRRSLEEIRGGDVAHNVQIVLSVLSGEKGPAREIVLLNAAAAMVVGGKVDSLAEGISVAAHSINVGAAYKKLEDLKVFSNHPDFTC